MNQKKIANLKSDPNSKFLFKVNMNPTKKILSMYPSRIGNFYLKSTRNRQKNFTLISEISIQSQLESDEKIVKLKPDLNLKFLFKVNMNPPPPPPKKKCQTETWPELEISKVKLEPQKKKCQTEIKHFYLKWAQTRQLSIWNRKILLKVNLKSTKKCCQPNTPSESEISIKVNLNPKKIWPENRSELEICI